MKNLKIVAAVAAALAGSAGAHASDLATTVDILTNFNAATDVVLTVAGASAARNSFGLELSPLKEDGTANPTGLCQNTTAPADRFDVYRSAATPSRDFRAYSCRLGTVATSGVNTNLNNRRAVIFYRSEGGSVWGPLSLNTSLVCAPSASTSQCATGGGSTIKRLSVNLATCNSAPATLTGIISGGTTLTTLTTDCAVGGYDFESDGGVAGVNSTGLEEATTEFAVADVEPNQFTFQPNYPSSGKFRAFTAGAATTAGTTKNLVNPINTASVKGFGEIFGVIVNNNVATQNLSTQDLVSIFSRSITDWGTVPNYSSAGVPAGYNTADAIKVCRREPGSGTQVISQAVYLGQGCNPSAPSFAAGDGVNVIENTTGTALNACMVSSTGTIGISVLGNAPAGTHFVNINGVNFSRANAAVGVYPFTSELTFTQRTGLATSNVNGQRLAAILTTRGQTAASMPNNASTFAIPFAVGTNLPVLPLSSTAPVALGTRNKNSCIPAGLTN